MKYLLLIVLLSLGPTLTAQDVPPAPGTSPMQENLPREPEQEMHALSGSLKDLHGQVHDQLGMIEKRLAGPTTDKTTNLLSRQREQLKEASTRLETMLGEVNSEGIDNWEMIKTKAEEVIQEVTETLERSKGITTSAVN